MTVPELNGQHDGTRATQKCAEALSCRPHDQRDTQSNAAGNKRQPEHRFPTRRPYPLEASVLGPPKPKHGLKVQPEFLTTGGRVSQGEYEQGNGQNAAH